MLPHLVTNIPGPRSLDLAKRLRAVESPDTTFLSPEFPIFWQSVSGANVTDVDGNRYVDLTAGFGVAAVGHNHPRVVEAIQRQSERLIHGMGDVHPSEVKVRLGEEIVRRAPAEHEWRVIFGLNGSDAVEAALKTAAIATGQPGVIVFEGAYHGLSLGTLPLTTWPKFRQGLLQSITEPATMFPFPPKNGAAALDGIARFLKGNNAASTRTGAIVIEPIQGRGGVRIPPPGFLAGLRGLCDEHELLLIFDEVFTGFGRTGYWFDCMHEGVVPDLIAAGKALGGGMPISVCIGRREIIDRWGVSDGEARHTSTFLGHPLACACALETIRILEEENLLRRSAEKGQLLIELLRAKLADRPFVSSIRGRGMMIGIEIVDPSTRAPDSKRAWKAVVGGLRKGVILLTAGESGNVISLTPPLIIGDAQMEFAANVLREVLDGS